MHFDDLRIRQKEIATKVNNQFYSAEKAALILYLYEKDKDTRDILNGISSAGVQVKTEEKDGFIICKYKEHLKATEINQIRRNLENAYEGKKKIILISDKFDLVDVPSIKIDSDKIKKEAQAEHYPNGTQEAYITTLFVKFIEEVNKQMHANDAVDKSKHHYLCDEHKCFMTCPIVKRRITKKKRIDAKKITAACSNPMLHDSLCAFYVAKDKCSNIGWCDCKRKLKADQ